MNNILTSLENIFNNFENTISNDYNLYLNIGNQLSIESGEINNLVNIMTHNRDEKDTLIIFFTTRDITIHGVKTQQNFNSNLNNDLFDYIGSLNNTYFFYRVPFYLPTEESYNLTEIQRVIDYCNQISMPITCTADCEMESTQNNIYVTGSINVSIFKPNLNDILNSINIPNFIQFLKNKCTNIINNQNIVHLNNGWFFNSSAALDINGNQILYYNEPYSPVFCTNIRTNFFLTKCIYFYKLIKELKSINYNLFTMSLDDNPNLINYEQFKLMLNFISKDNYFP